MLLVCAAQSYLHYLVALELDRALHTKHILWSEWRHGKVPQKVL